MPGGDRPPSWNLEQQASTRPRPDEGGAIVNNVFPGVSTRSLIAFRRKATSCRPGGHRQKRPPPAAPPASTAVGIPARPFTASTKNPSPHPTKARREASDTLGCHLHLPVQAVFANLVLWRPSWNLILQKTAASSTPWCAPPWPRPALSQRGYNVLPNEARAASICVLTLRGQQGEGPDPPWAPHPSGTRG